MSAQETAESRSPGLRERKKAQTRRAIQEHALRLFLSKGYEATTVEEIAAAANVSPMTFFRYFPRKEDVVMDDEYDPVIYAAIAGRTADESPLDAIRRGLADTLPRVYAADRDALLARTRLLLSAPALRARLWEQQAATELLIARALAAQAGHREAGLETRVIAAACLAAVTTAVVLWAENDGAEDLPGLVDRALAVLGTRLGRTDG